MTITQVIPDFPDAPQRSDGPDAFAVDADPFVASFQPFVDAVNAWAAQVNSTNFSIPYKSTDLGGVTPTGPTPSLWLDDTVTPSKAYIWDAASSSYAQFGLVDPSTTPNPLIDPTVSTLRMSARSDGNGLAIGTGVVDAHEYGDVAIGKSANLDGTGNSNVSVGMQANMNGAGNGRIAIGFSAGANPTNASQQYSVVVGHQAAEAGAPYGSVNIGAFAGRFAAGTYSVNNGYAAGMYSNGTDNVSSGAFSGYNADLDRTVAVGSYAGHCYLNSVATGAVKATTTNAVAVGSYAAYLAETKHCIAVGSNAGAYSGASYTAAIGSGAAASGSHEHTIALGPNSIAGRSTKNVTALGSATSVPNVFDVNGLPVTFDPVTQRFTALGHGLGANGTYRAFQFEPSTTTVPAGAASALPYVFKIIDADTLELVRRSFTTAGAGLIIKVQRVYTNTTLLGYGATGTADNEVVLGNGAVTTVRSAGDAIFNGTLYTSDRRLKKAIKPIEDAIGMLNKLEFVTYKWDFNSPTMVRTEAYEVDEEVEPAEIEDIIDTDGDGKITRKEVRAARREKCIVEAQLRVPLRERGKTQIGLIADNVEAVIPEAVREVDGIKVVDYAKVAALYGAAIKEQQLVIEKLTADVAALQRQVKGLIK